MNQYQRMVSYLYEYRQGIKGVNVGFVRIELRGDMCRFQVQMRGRNLENVPAAACFRQDDEGIQCLEIGQMAERNGGYYCRLDTHADDILGQGVRFSEVDGLILYQDDSYYIATTWKNAEVVLGTMRKWDTEQYKGKVEAAGIEYPDAPRIAALEMRAAEEESARQENEPRQDGVKDDEQVESRREEIELSERESEQREPRWDREERNEPERSEPERNEWNSDERRENEPEGDAWNRDERERITTDEREMEQGEETAESVVQVRSSMETKEICGNCPFQRKDLDYGKKILMTFPSMRPFPQDTNRCVRIEPQDIGCLPIKMWPLANNHFLLHGYYSYRYLVFLETGEKEYAIGVPGIYTERDKRQARQFGFSAFRSICTREQCRGAFGYWLIPLSCFR